jgi:hypothetical protein
MHKTTSRALRRHHRARMQQRAVKIYMKYETYWLPEQQYDTTRIAINASRTRDNMAICSCDSCGNPRRTKWESKTNQLTLAEQRSFDNFKQQVNDLQ